ncbi:MAG: SdrD B-like domain-containing protein, partial [Anaerolineae bacterium]
MKPKQKTSKFIRLFFIISLIATFQVLIDISSVLADYVGTDVNRIFIDPDSMGVITDGYQVGDEVSFIFETTPAYDGKSLVGMAAWSTVYIPAGVEVISATLVAESGGSYVNIPAKDTAAAQDDCGPRGCNFATSGTLQNGQVNQVQQDTGIFYSTDAQTALLGTPQSISPTGPNVTPQNVYNQWDYNQVLAFGAKTPTALSGNSGKGNTPVVQIGGVWYGTGSPVAGPDTFYQNDYDPTCNSGGGFENNLHCTGPWQRIQHPNAKAGGSGPIVPATTGGKGTAALLNTAVPTTTGYVLSPANPLPAGVNTVRFVHGIRRVGDMETSRITFRITDAAAFTASFTNNTFCLDATGGDHDKPADPVKGKPARGPQDNNWRYYEGNPHSCFQGSADAALLKQVEYVNGAPASGANLTPGDVIGYAVTFYNTTPAALYDVALSDVPMTTNLTLVAPGTAGCAYTSYDGDQAGSTPAYNGGTSGTWAALSSLAAGSSVTVHVCAQVNSGAAFGDAVKNQAFADYATTPGGATTTLNSTTQGYISTQIAGTVYHDKDSSTNYSVGDSGLNGFTAQLWDSAGTTLLATTTTNPDGSYEFNGFPAGDYQVVVLDATGYVSTGDVVGANDDTVPVTLP